MTSCNKTAKSLRAGNTAKSMTSEGNSAMLTYDGRSSRSSLCYYNKSLNDWSLGKLANFVSLESRGTKLTVSLERVYN